MQIKTVTSAMIHRRLKCPEVDLTLEQRCRCSTEKYRAVTRKAETTPPTSQVYIKNQGPEPKSILGSRA